jgi:metal-dependent amidase/aminoacylase/carboxypeptidase family protein
VDTDLISVLPTVRPAVDEVVAAVHRTPELAYEEVQTAALLIERLENLGARVSQSVAGLVTCFRAELGPEDGPAVGVVVPLDAVPIHVGESVIPMHACGHELIAGAAVGAAQLLTSSPGSLRGRLVIMGIPADEIDAPAVRARGAGKAVTAEAGVWDDLDAVLYAHPEFLDTVWLSSPWASRRRITLRGPRIRASDTPDVEAAFTLILRACRDLVNHHGPKWVVIEAATFEGGVEEGSPCVAEVSVLVYAHESAQVEQRLHELSRVIGEAVGGSELSPEITKEGITYEGILPNTVLLSAVAAAFGESYVPAPGDLPFATDFGNLSRRAPSALIGIGRPGGWRFHTEEGAEEFASQDGREVAARLAQVLALTVSTLTSDRDLLAQARAEFEARRADM